MKNHKTQPKTLKMPSVQCSKRESDNEDIEYLKTKYQMEKCD